MPNKLKTSGKSRKPNPDKLLTEKETRVEMKQLVRDERTKKIIGSVLLLLSFFLFTAFTSYLFTWAKDQDKVFRHGISILKPNELEIANLLGSFGAYISYLFFYKGFGLASFLFCTLLFVTGANLLFAKKVFSIRRNVKYVVTGVILFSVLFAFVFQGSAFSWGGEAGNMMNRWLTGFLGKLGTAALLFVAGLAYIIWRFNPSFKVPERKFAFSKKTAEANKDDIPETGPVNEAVHQKGNYLKAENENIVPTVTAENKSNPDFKLTEKEEAKAATDKILNDLFESKANEPSQATINDSLKQATTPSKKGQVKRNNSGDLKLEINPVHDGQIPEEEIIETKTVNALPPYDPVLDLRDYKYPSLDLLEQHGSEKIVMDPGELETNKNQIINTLKNYDIEIQKITATVGPTVTLYEIVPAAGVRISRIKNLEDDIALSLSALGIRIIAPIPGRGTIGIEVPNVRKAVVSMRGLLSSDKFQHSHFSLPIALGKKIDNDNFIVDLTSMPHLLMAGATGQGKSVGVNAILVSLLYKKHPSQLKFVLVDPKKVELSLYRTIEKHFLAKLPGEEEAIITDTKKVVHTLNALCIEMDNRYDLLKEAGCRNIKEYNEKFVGRKLNPEKGHQFLPFIVLVIDEFADLIMTAGKEIEMPIARLAQLARAVGIHLIIATQRPSVNIITGTIKANFPVRIAFKVSSKVDSRTIIDTGGAEQLIGRGDMLISYNGEITRLQCAFVDTPEVETVVECIGEQRGYPQAFLLPEYIDEKDLEGRDFDLTDRDPLFEDAARLIVQSQMGSTSLLQRRMKLGYNRAGRLMDQLEAAGIVGPNQGSKARDVLVKTEPELEQYLQAPE